MHVHKTDKIIIGQSEPSMRMKKLITMVAPTSGPVLILGPTGAGKELVAEAIHRESGRRGQLIALNCAAIPGELLESELFGYEKGAFTGADRQRIGRFEQANEGTIFLDEIGDLPFQLQSKLLRVLETKTIQRVGGKGDIKLNFRLVCATHQKISVKIERGEFREDLFYRLNVFPIEVPTLSERREDISDIVSAMVGERIATDGLSLKPEFDVSAINELLKHDWPGNIRELRNVVDRAFIIFPDKTITGKHVRENLLHLRVPTSYEIDDQDTVWESVGALSEDNDFVINLSAPSVDDYAGWFSSHDEIDLRVLIRDLEVVLIEAALEKYDGSVSKAANALKLRRTTLIEKMKKLSIEKKASPVSQSSLI